MYQEEFLTSLETPEQVREKMAERLFELKEQRNQERLDFVNSRKETQFRDTTDAIRAYESKFYTIQSQIDREHQMMEKKRKLDNDILEEKIYAELWKQDMKRKGEREEKEKIEKAKLRNETLEVLEWQN
jgi:hypothetical protein